MPVCPWARALLSALLTAGIVGALMLLLRRLGPRASGVGAALPLSSLLALLILWDERGPIFAAEAAGAGLWATVMSALAALGYGWLSQRLRAPLALALTLLGLAGCAALSLGLVGMPVLTLVLAVALSLAPLPHPLPLAPRRTESGRSQAWLAIGFAALSTALVDALSREVGPAWCGVIPALPVVGFSAACAAHAHGGRPMVGRFLRGYLDGTLLRAVFLATMDLALRLGLGPWAWALALAVSLSAWALQQGWQRLAAIPRNTGASARSPGASA